MNEATVFFNEKEKLLAAEITAAAFAAMYDAGQLKHGIVISNGEIVGREADA